MTNTTNYRTQMRAVFLAAIMVVSVVGMSVAFAGAATATQPDDDFFDFDPDRPYQGQDVTVTNGTDHPDSGTTGSLNVSDEYDLYVVDSEDEDRVESASFVEEFEVNADHQIIVETDDLEAGNYFLRGAGDASDKVPRRPMMVDTFEVRVQDLDAEFDEDDLPVVNDDFDDSQVNLELDSSRSGYSTNVSADGDLDNEELFNIFTINAVAAVDDEILANSGTNNLTTSEGDLYWNVTDDGEPVIVDTSGNVVEFDGGDLDGDEASFDSVYDAIETLGDAGEEIAPLTYDGTDLLTLSDYETTYDGDEVIEPDADLGGVALYAESQDDDDADFDEKIVLFQVGDFDDDVSFAGIDEGEYEFDFNVADTDASASATAQVNELDVDGSFSQGTYQATTGDLAHFEFELEDSDEAWIQIGDEDSDFVDVIYVELDESDEPVEITVNTRLLGNPTSDVDLTDPEDVYDVENADVFESAMHGGISEGQPSGVALFEDDGNVFTGSFDDQFEAYLDELGIIDSDDDSKDDQLTRPLQATDYELQLAGDDVDDAIFDADAGAGEANDQLDSAVLELTQASIGDIITHVAPEEAANDEDDIAELLEIVTQRDEIAADDRLIVQVEATGLYGGLIAGPEDRESLDVDFDRLEDGVSTDVMDNFFDVEEINFNIEADARTGNQDPLEVSFDGDDDDTYLLIGPNQEQFFLIVDTSSDSAFNNGDAPEDGESFTATFEYDADNEDERFEFDEDNPDPFNPEGDAENYPYLPQGEVLSTSAEFDIEPRTVSFDNLNADDEVQAENVEDSEISGTTNIAPGSSAELRVASTDASTSFRIGQSVDINEDGELSATFDFSNQEVGDEFDTRFRAEGSGVDTVSSIIVAEGDLGVEEPDDEADDEDDVVDDDEDVVDDDDEVVDDDDDVEEPTDDETPGFGALVALVALIGAALLAVRRQN